MKPAGTRTLQVERLTRGDLQGYLSLALTVLLFVIPFLPIPSEFGTEIGLLLLTLILVSGLRGVQFDGGGGRAAAWLSLAVLSTWMLVSVVIACTELCRPGEPSSR
jgi:hypothetical protein